MKISDFADDAGYEINLDLIKKPALSNILVRP